MSQEIEYFMKRMAEEAPELVEKIASEVGGFGSFGDRSITNIERLEVLANEPSTKTAMQNDPEIRKQITKIAKEAEKEQDMLKLAELTAEMVIVKLASAQALTGDYEKEASELEGDAVRNLLDQMS